MQGDRKEHEHKGAMVLRRLGQWLPLGEQRHDLRRRSGERLHAGGEGYEPVPILSKPGAVGRRLCRLFKQAFVNRPCRGIAGGLDSFCDLFQSRLQIRIPVLDGVEGVLDRRVRDDG